MTENINDLWNAIEKLKYSVPPIFEFKIHPQDYEKLKRQSADYLPHPMPEIPDVFMGVKIIVDPSAELLKRG